MKTYLTVKNQHQTELLIKKSTFICSVARTESEEQATQFIAQVKASHAKATHNCFAYLLGMQNEIQRSSDNGEPSGTAGHPILEVLKKNNLRNVTAVVTRYFGGIKLGTGGLIRAYSQATSQALTAETIVICQPQQILELEIAYPQLGKLQHFLESEAISLINTEYLVSVTLTVAVPQENATQFEKKVIELLNNAVKIKKGQLRYRELPYHA